MFDWIFKFQKKKPRKGYFLIAFSLILVMLQVPIWVNMLSLDYKVKSEIKRWNESDFVTGLGNSIMQAELSRLSKNGPGFFAFNQQYVHEDTPSGSPLTVNYNFLGASVIPVPTWLYDESSISKSIIPGGPSVLDAVYADCATTVVEGLCLEAPRHMYSSPALGTGNAGSDCQPGKIRTDLYYPVEDSDEELIPVDPLDDPCQWDKIALGQSIAIPLFVLDPDNPDIVHVFDPDTLVLRVRKPCIVPGQEICKGGDRWETVLDQRGVLGLFQYDTLSVVDTDYSDRILDVALVANNFMLPDNSYARGVGNDKSNWEPRTLSNREVTEKRLMYFAEAVLRLDPAFGQANLPTAVNDNISIVNLAGIGFADLLNSDSKFVWLNEIKFENEILGLFNPRDNIFYSNASSIFSSANICNQLFKNQGCEFNPLGGRYGAKVTGNKSEGFVPPYLVIKMINNMFEVTDGSGNKQLLQNLEFQLLSNKPLGGTRNAVYGFADYLDNNYTMKDYLGKHKNLEIIKDTGVVFSN